MSYSVEYTNCKVCGSDRPKFLGIRGNLEYMQAPALKAGEEHMVTNVVRCRKCGFIYTNPKIVLPPEKANFYNDPREYFSSISLDPLKIFRNTLNLMEKFSKQKGRLLDVGAGKGEFLAAAKRRGWEVFGIEPSYRFVQYAKEKYDLDIRQVSLEEADFPEDFFDVVTLNMVLEHVDEPHSLLSSIHRILKNDGLFYIEVPNIESALLKMITIYYRFRRKEWSPHLSALHRPYHCYGYGRSCLKLICAMNKFTIKKFFVFGIGLRGFRPYYGSNKLRQYLRDALARIAGWIKQGDILVALAIKK